MVWAVTLLVSLLVICQIQDTESGRINSTTFENDCTSEGDYELVSDAQCKPCVCPKNYKPVCGTDQRSYKNDCFARCRNVKVACETVCPCFSACICPAAVFELVCGNDGITYRNRCEAKCADAEVTCEGHCASCKAWYERTVDRYPA